MVYCRNCGAALEDYDNYCPYCGTAVRKTTESVSLLNKSVSVAQATNNYNLVLVSTGTCDRILAGDLLEDVFGYTDAESGSLVGMAPVVVGENLTAEEALTVAQLFTEYGIQVSITDRQDQYVDLTAHANTSVFDSNEGLLASAAAIIGALTVSNRISSYRRYKRPSLLERLFHINYNPAPPAYRRNFRPHLIQQPLAPRHTIRQSPRPAAHTAPRSQGIGRTNRQPDMHNRKESGKNGPGNKGPGRGH